MKDSKLILFGFLQALGRLYYGSRTISEGTSDQIIGGADTARKKPALMPCGLAAGSGLL